MSRTLALSVLMTALCACTATTAEYPGARITGTVISQNRPANVAPASNGEITGIIATHYEPGVEHPYCVGADCNCDTE